MAGHRLSIRQTAGKQALMVTVLVGASGMTYGQQEAWLPHGEVHEGPKETLVQKHGISAGMG